MAAALLVFLSSCDFFQKAQSSGGLGNNKDRTTERDNDRNKNRTGEELDDIQGRKVYDPVSGTYVEIELTPTETMDTIFWKDIPPSVHPPITTDPNIASTDGPGELIRIDQFGSQILSSYKVSVLLPFLTNRFDPDIGNIYKNSTWALNFYGGVKMALEELEVEGVNLSVDVFDTEANELRTEQLLRENTDIKQSNLIIGPYRRDNVRLVAEFARRNEITFISPYSASQRISTQNPYYVQVSPTLKTHCEAITNHVLDRYAVEDVVLVVRDEQAEKARLQYFHEENYRRAGTRDTTTFQEFIVSESSGNLTNMPFIELSDTTVFIIPSYQDKRFIYSLLSKIETSRKPNDYIVVYGMPQWMRFELNEYDYYEKLNVHVSSNNYLDPLSPEIQFFKRRFFDRYGAVPTDEAYLGYDVMLYVGKMLNQYGTRFQYSMETEPSQSLHTRFEFERVLGDYQPFQTERAPVNQFENKYVNILKFEDYQFQQAN